MQKQSYTIEKDKYRNEENKEINNKLKITKEGKQNKKTIVEIYREIIKIADKINSFDTSFTSPLV